MTKLSIVSAMLIVGMASTLSAMEYKSLGVKMNSMGGAGIASKPDSLSVYTNPAMLAKSVNTVELSLGAGVGYVDNKLGASVSELESQNFTTKLANFDPATATQADIDSLIAGKNVVLGMDKNSLNISPEAYFGVQIKQFGLGLFGYGDINVQSNISQAHNQLIIQDPNTLNYVNIETNTASDLTSYQNSSVEYAINNGLTNIGLKGLAVAEVPVGYGKSFSTPIGTISTGASLKYMYGMTYSESISIDNTDFTNTLDTKKVNSSTFGVDLGFLYEPKFLKDSRIALVTKNLNTPKFDTWDGGSIEIKPQYRVGLAYDIFPSLEVVVDMDLTENDTLVDSLKSQMIGGGINWSPTSWTSLRAGLKENISSTSNNAMVYTGGASFGTKWLQLDVAAQYSSAANEIQGTSIPEEVKINFAIVSKW